MDLEDLLSALETTLKSARALPLSSTCMVNRTELLALVDRARETLPELVSEAQEVVQAREDVLAWAHEEARVIVDRARKESQQIVNRQDWAQLASARAEEILSRAENEANRLMKEADDYVDSRLEVLEATATSTLRQVTAGRSRLMERHSQRRHPRLEEVMHGPAAHTAGGSRSTAPARAQQAGVAAVLHADAEGPDQTAEPSSAQPAAPRASAVVEEPENVQANGPLIEPTADASAGHEMSVHEQPADHVSTHVDPADLVTEADLMDEDPQVAHLPDITPEEVSPVEEMYVSLEGFYIDSSGRFVDEFGMPSEHPVQASPEHLEEARAGDEDSAPAPSWEQVSSRATSASGGPVSNSGAMRSAAPSFGRNAKNAPAKGARTSKASTPSKDGTSRGRGRKKSAVSSSADSAEPDGAGSGGNAAQDAAQEPVQKTARKSSQQAKPDAAEPAQRQEMLFDQEELSFDDLLGNEDEIYVPKGSQGSHVRRAPGRATAGAKSEAPPAKTISAKD